MMNYELIKFLDKHGVLIIQIYKLIVIKMNYLWN